MYCQLFLVVPMQGYHRDLLERMAPPVIALMPPPPASVDEKLQKTIPDVPADNTVSAPTKKIPTKRARDRKSRRHRKVAAGGGKDVVTAD